MKQNIENYFEGFEAKEIEKYGEQLQWKVGCLVLCFSIFFSFKKRENQLIENVDMNDYNRKGNVNGLGAKRKNHCDYGLEQAGRVGI